MGDFVSNIAGLFGGGANGAGYEAHQADLTQPVTSGQITASADKTNAGIYQQQDLVRALQGQGAQGIDTQSNLTNALIAQASGQGPNPAQAALNAQTGQNIQNQASLAAGQRGAASNVGLIERQNAQQGAGIQQNAVGQGAVLQAQQQLAAQQQLQQLAGTQIGQQQSGLNNLNNVSLQNQGQLLGALQGYNQAKVGNISQQNAANAGLSSAQTTGQLGLIGKGITAIAAAAEGGDVKENQIGDNPRVDIPDHLRGLADIYHPTLVQRMCAGGTAMSKGAVVPGNPKEPGKNTIKNDVVPAMLTPKEIVLPLSVTQAKNPGEAAKAFVEHIKGPDQSREEKGGDFKQALRDHIKNRKKKA